MPPQALWTVLAEFPLFVLRAFAYPRSLVRNLDWEKPETLQRLGLYAVLWLSLLVLAFSDSRELAEAARPRLSSFKGIVMRGHDASWAPEPGHGWDWLRLQPVYGAMNMELPEAKRLWDNLLDPGLVCYILLAGLLATALVARLRMWRFGMSWEYALGTGILGYLTSASLAALSLVPVALLLNCRHCWVRLVLYVVLNFAAWAYMGYFTLGDLGERPAGGPPLLAKSIGWGFAVFMVTYLIFFVLMVPVLPV